VRSLVELAQARRQAEQMEEMKGQDWRETPGPKVSLTFPCSVCGAGLAPRNESGLCRKHRGLNRWRKKFKRAPNHQGQ
jgi:hypothetical protein